MVFMSEWAWSWFWLWFLQGGPWWTAETETWSKEVWVCFNFDSWELSCTLHKIFTFSCLKYDDEFLQRFNQDSASVFVFMAEKIQSIQSINLNPQIQQAEHSDPTKLINQIHFQQSRPQKVDFVSSSFEVHWYERRLVLPLDAAR